jgi:glycosyltransferase involved in cell wall biosynthesis
VPPESPGAVADALLRLVESAPLREGFGQRGRATIAQRYTLDGMTKQLQTLYSELVERPPGVGVHRTPRRSGVPA